MRNSSKGKRPFSQILIEATDEGLEAFGEQTKNVVYYHLEREFGVRKEEIPQKLEEFDKGLKNLFGLGGELVETHILKNLYRRLGQTFEAIENRNFQNCIRDAERNFRERSRRLEDE